VNGATTGTSSGTNLSTMLFGNWQDVIIGVWGQAGRFS
jgi:hypothetical protein